MSDKKQTLDDEVPFIAVDASDLGAYLTGTDVHCSKCGGSHTVQYGTTQENGKTVPSKTLGFYKCGDSSYMATIKGKLLRGVRNADNPQMPLHGSTKHNADPETDSGDAS